MQTRAKMTGQLLKTRQRECNISKEEQDILKHMQALGNIRMDKLDTNLGIVVYFVSCETEAIKGHLDYKEITKLQTYDGQNMIEARQKLWIILNSPSRFYFCSISFCMYLFDNLSSSSVDKFASTRLKSISSALALPVSRGRHAKLIVNFSHESDVTSLDPFLFYYCVPHKIRRGILLTTHADIRHLLDSLVSALAVYATAFRSRLSLVMSPDQTSRP